MTTSSSAGSSSAGSSSDGSPIDGSPIAELLERLAAMTDLADELPDADTPLGQTTREFLDASWRSAADGLLARTDKIRVEPMQREHPRSFRFEMDLPYKSKPTRDGPVEHVRGPLRGTIRFRPDLFMAPANEPCIAVRLDHDQHVLHPNFSRQHGMLCLGPVPRDMTLERLLEHLFSILSYQNISTTDPADVEAAAHFALEPHALDGLGQVDPLY
jgi:hypothetical protein